MWEHACEVRGQPQMLVFTFPYCFEAGSLVLQLRSSGELQDSLYLLSISMLELQMLLLHIHLFMGSEDPNSSCYACIAHIFPTESSPLTPKNVI